MSQTCTICRHKDHEEIDKLLISGQPMRVLASQFDVSFSSLQRHKENCIPQELLKANDIKEYTHAQKLACRLKDDSDVVRKMRDEAIEEGDIDKALRAVDRSLKCIDLCAKIQGLIQTAPQVNVAVVNLGSSPEWLAARTVIFEVLQHHPEALEDMRQRLSVMRLSP